MSSCEQSEAGPSQQTGYHSTSSVKSLLTPPANVMYQPPSPANPMSQPTPPANLMFQPTPPANLMYQPTQCTIQHLQPIWCLSHLQPIWCISQHFQPMQCTIQHLQPIWCLIWCLSQHLQLIWCLNTALPLPPFSTPPKLVPIKQVMKDYPGSVVPFCGVPEALLSDRGTNLLSHLITDACRLSGVRNLKQLPTIPSVMGWQSASTALWKQC